MAEPAGPVQLTIQHRLVDGQIDSTQAGGVIESRDYNSYGELANLRYRIGSAVLLQQSITRDALGRADGGHRNKATNPLPPGGVWTGLV